MSGTFNYTCGSFIVDEYYNPYKPYIQKQADRLISCEFCSSSYWVVKNNCSCPKCGAAAKVEFEYK